jgi:Tol biopolymer transport system component
MKIGETLGPYRIQEKLGEGGMGEVYRATDTQLKRAVAIKVLPESVVGDADRLARFQREAEVLAALNHPNIAHIHGLEKTVPSTGTGPAAITALIMELVEGDDLSVLVARGPIPLAEALPIARQIAEALEAAHERGIVHRDLKPANIKVRDDGTVKVLDFGLAKALAPEGASGTAEAMQSPTMTSPAVTAQGIILGTAAYMAPEQARGKMVDKRADIWAFGCVVYEMLTGTRAFEGETLTDVLAAVVKSDPDWNALPPDTPRILRSLLRRCLQKDPGKRLRDIADARLEIQEAMDEPETSARAAPERRRTARWVIALPWLVTAVVALVSGVAYLRRVPVGQAATKLSVLPPEGAAISTASAPAISPDGHRLAFVAVDSAGKAMLWVRSLDSLVPQPLLGTEDAAQPFWSPDNRFVAFFSQGKLKKTNVSGGGPQTICDGFSRTTFGGTWNPDGVILFARGSMGPVESVSDGSGQPRPATALDRTRQERGHQFPHFLPDGRHFLYLAVSAAREYIGVYVASLGSTERTRLLDLESEVRYAAPGYLLFEQGGTLMARPFDAPRLALAGPPSPVAEHVASDRIFVDAMFSASDNGVLAYQTGGSGKNRQLQWFDHSGHRLSTVGPVGEYLNPELTVDGKRVAVERIEPRGDRDIWLLESEAGTPRKFTFTPADEYMPVWSPDGSRIVYAASRPGTPGGPNGLYQKASSGLANEELLYASDDAIAPQSWSIDGLLAFRRAVKAFNEPWILPLSGDRTPFQFLPSANFNTAQVQVSPDGKWAAYYSNESGQAEVYVQSFPKPAAPQQLSVDGGVQPRWSRDGTELYYIGLDTQLVAVAIKRDLAGLRPGARTVLFKSPQAGGARTVLRFRQQYDVAPNGRFLINVLVAEGASAPITIVQNWAAGLKK